MQLWRRMLRSCGEGGLVGSLVQLEGALAPVATQSVGCCCVMIK